MHAFLKINLFLGELVLAFGSVFGQVRGFPIALEAQSDVVSGPAKYEHVRAEPRIDLRLIVVTLRFSRL